MRALLVQARSPTTYWSFEHALPFVGKAATYPPLGIATLAALLPPRWELRLRDLHVAPLDDADLAWADVVLVSGMLIQLESMRGVLRRARAMGRRTVVGGPAPSTAPELFEEADHVFRGEAEGRLDLLVRVLEAPTPEAPRLLSPAGDERPDLRLARVPRFDLLDALAVREPRAPVLARLPVPVRVLRHHRDLRAGAEGEVAGAGGGGARRAARARRPRDAVLRRRQLRRRTAARSRGSCRCCAPGRSGTGSPSSSAPRRASTSRRTPSSSRRWSRPGSARSSSGSRRPPREALAQAKKTQNLRMPQERAVEELTRAGLEVYAGFIVGFDSDGPDIFDRQLAFISGLPIARAMVNLLTALPGTQLWRRLEREGRLRGAPSGDSFERPNFVPALDERTLLAGYRRLLAALYSPDAYLPPLRAPPRHGAAPARRRRAQRRQRVARGALARGVAPRHPRPTPAALLAARRARPASRDGPPPARGHVRDRGREPHPLHGRGRASAHRRLAVGARRR